jgi:hypothetical protein
MWSGSGGFQAREYVPPGAQSAQSRPRDESHPEDLKPEPTRVRLFPAARQPGRGLRTAARREGVPAFRPRPTAEGVVVQRPIIIADPGRPKPEPETLPLDERSLDQVILAYLAEDLNKKK